MKPGPDTLPSTILSCSLGERSALSSSPPAGVKRVNGFGLLQVWLIFFFPFLLSGNTIAGTYKQGALEHQNNSDLVLMQGNALKNNDGVIFFEDFEQPWGYQFQSDALSPVNPNEWVNLNNQTNKLWVQSGSPGNYVARHDRSNQNHNSWLISPVIQLESGRNYIFSFEELLIQYNASVITGVKISDGGASLDRDDFSFIYQHSLGVSGPGNTMVLKEIELSGDQGRSIRIAFVYQNPEAINRSRWVIDNVTVKEVFSFQVEVRDPVPDGSGLVTPPPGNYEFDEIVDIDLIASPNSGYTFLHWALQGDDSPPVQITDARHTLTIDQNFIIEPVFEAYDLDLVLIQDGYGTNLAGIDQVNGDYIAQYINVPEAEFWQKIVFHAVAVNLSAQAVPWFPGESELFDVLFFQYEEDGNGNPLEPQWNNPLLVFENLSAKAFQTQDTFNFNIGPIDNDLVVFKFELDLPENGISLQEGWLTLKYKGTDQLFWLEALEGGANLSWNQTNGFATPIDYMLELWGMTSYVWTGAVSTDWFLVDNWAQFEIPTQDINVLIPAEPDNQPVIATGLTGVARRVTIANGALLTVSSGSSLQVYDDFIVEGNIQVQGTIDFMGADSDLISSNPLIFGNVNLLGNSLTLQNSIIIQNFLNLYDGVIIVGNNDFVVQVENGGSIIYNNGRIAGTIRHYIPVEPTQAINLPVGTIENNRWVFIDYTEGPGFANDGYLDARFIPFSDGYDPFNNVDDFYSNVNFSNGVLDEDLIINTLSEEGIWYIAPMEGIEGVTNGTITIAFCTCGIPGITIPEDLRVLARKPGNPEWKMLGNHIYPEEILPGVYWVKREKVPSPGDSDNPGYLDHNYWALGSNFDINPLPIELLYYTATCLEDEVLVQWVTATETNNSHFILERAGENGRFEAIARIEGAGNSSQVMHYAFTDRPAGDGGVIYYRLTQHDFDGKYETFAPIALECSPTIAQGYLRVFPNPANSHITLETKSPLQTNAVVEVYTLSGVLMMQVRMELFRGFNTQSFRIGHLPAGLYLLRVTSRDVSFGSQRLYVR